MRISDWSSDVCSSDLDAYLRGLAKEVQLLRDEYAKIEQARAADDSDAETAALFAMTSSAIDEAGAVASGLPSARYDYISNRIDANGDRSEERRVGKECGSTCRSWWGQSLKKKK